jgi:hypothetical protein
MNIKGKSANPYSFFKYTEIEKHLTELINKECSFYVMEKFIEFGLPPAAAFSAEVEKLYTDACAADASFKKQLDNLKKYFGYLVGQALETKGYITQTDQYGRTIRGKVKGNKFFKTATKFVKTDMSLYYKKPKDNPFMKAAGVAEIGDIDPDTIIYDK